ncbi:hypothetical protein ROLI_021850 [Roseobacter fucihabitans]|uniref:DUF6456 domain-containing protein n=1 Tax=Roseobacter fucihabitans TaxID=1537242 RepID=A0ABZ2BSU1_9RHOB|nr:DUF6456 domain-containing protein [Roseobacter litoralis]MBC6967755.1 hypothetical protein [Roseobacter litoralis]
MNELETPSLRHNEAHQTALPDWVPAAAQVYLAHTEAGLPIRALARAAGCHASTILRQIRRVETRRDDPLVDAALKALGAAHFVTGATAVQELKKDAMPMSFQDRMTTPLGDPDTPPSEASLMAEGARVLRRLCEKGAVLAVAAEMEKAVIVRDGAGTQATRTGVVTRKIAEAMALKEWISPQTTGKITRYTITAAGRAALEGMLGSEEGIIAVGGFAEAPADFAGQRNNWGEKTLPDVDTGRPRRMRYNLAESPLTALARRRDKNGENFLDDDLVTVGERLREDFELAQMGPRVTQNWDRFLTSGGCGSFVPDSGVGDGPSNARKRVADALADLGPGLSDVVLRCCCYLEGLETAEKKLGWSARSGKIVLRIALMRLKRHYDETIGPGGPLIG